MYTRKKFLPPPPSMKKAVPMCGGDPFQPLHVTGGELGKAAASSSVIRREGGKERRRSGRGERFRRRRRHFGKVKEVANEGSLPPPRRRRMVAIGNLTILHVVLRRGKGQREGERAETRRRRRRLESGDATFGPSSGKQQGGWKIEGVSGRRFSSSSWPILADAGK